MIRRAEAGDIPRILDMGQRFFEAAGWPEVATWDAESMARTLGFLIERPEGAVFVLEVDGQVAGMAGGMLNPFYFNANHLTGQELFWWVEPEHRGQGGKLFDALEGWARDSGARSFSMIALDRIKPDLMGRIYRMRGYRAAEHSYIKVL